MGLSSECYLSMYPLLATVIYHPLLTQGTTGRVADQAAQGGWLTKQHSQPTQPGTPANQPGDGAFPVNVTYHRAGG